MRFAFAASALLFLAAPATAQMPDPAATQAAQREAIARLHWMDGVWRGPAWALTQQGRREVTQTERIGTFLSGTIRVIEGRGYDAAGEVAFNAFGVISYDPRSQAFSLSSWAQGQSGVFPLRPTDDGYFWEIPAGPGRTIRYTATLHDGSWREIGEMVAGEAPPVQIFEMNLTRVGDTDWPGAGTVPMR